MNILMNKRTSQCLSFFFWHSIVFWLQAYKCVYGFVNVSECVCLCLENFFECPSGAILLKQFCLNKTLTLMYSTKFWYQTVEEFIRYIFQIQIIEQLMLRRFYRIFIHIRHWRWSVRFSRFRFYDTFTLSMNQYEKLSIILSTFGSNQNYFFSSNFMKHSEKNQYSFAKI